MYIIMMGVDHTTAEIAVREQFALTKKDIETAYAKLANHCAGAVIISTCNRTEFYLSLEKPEDDMRKLLCDICECDYALADHVTLRRDDAVIEHLCALACGMESQVWGEDQIIAQVKTAITTAREHHACDSVLEVLFRTAITAAKRVRTDVRVSSHVDGAAGCAVEAIKSAPNIHGVLVIGNGETGRAAASLLATEGYAVSITLRQYHNGGGNIVPDGVTAVDYGARYDYIHTFDAVISATLSPHYTIELDKLPTVIPQLFIDLAVPRDIEPTITSRGVKLLDIDSLCADQLRESHESQRCAAEAIIAHYVENYKVWMNRKSTI